MIACIDVGYDETESKPTTALAACVVINDWSDSVANSEHVAIIDNVEDYQPGQFYRRELPCIESVLARLPTPPTHIVVDGYVWLEDQNQPGLGAYLYESLNQETPVIGVAKTPFKRALQAAKLFRGGSKRPLYVTSIGIPLEIAVDHIAAMAGSHRIPTILKRVDQMSRDFQPRP